MHTFPKWMLIPSATVFSQSWPAKDSVVDMFSLCNPVSPSIIFVVCSSSSVLDVASGECCCASSAHSYGINNSLLPVLLYRVWWLFLPQNSSWGFSFLFRSTQLVRPAEYSLDIVPRPRFNRISIISIIIVNICLWVSHHRSVSSTARHVTIVISAGETPVFSRWVHFVHLYGMPRIVQHYGIIAIHLHLLWRVVALACIVCERVLCPSPAVVDMFDMMMMGVQIKMNIPPHREWSPLFGKQALGYYCCGWPHSREVASLDTIWRHW